MWPAGIQLDHAARDNTSLMMEAVRTSETSVDNHFTRQYIPEDNSGHFNACCPSRLFLTYTPALQTKHKCLLTNSAHICASLNHSV
jgi:hypothetical protein